MGDFMSSDVDNRNKTDIFQNWQGCCCRARARQCCPACAGTCGLGKVQVSGSGLQRSDKTVTSFYTACAKPVQQRFYPALLLRFWELHGTWRAHDEWQYPEPGVWQSRSHLWIRHGCRTNDAWVPVLHTVCPWSKQGGLQQLCFVTLCTDTYTHRGLRVDGNLKKNKKSIHKCVQRIKSKYKSEK